MADTKHLVKFASFSTKDAFETVKDNYGYYIVFIEDTKQIYANGNYYAISSSDYSSLVSKVSTLEGNSYVVSGANGITITTDDTAKTKVATIKINTTSAGNVTLSQDTNGLKANVDLSSYANAVTGVSGNVLTLSSKTISTTLSLSYDSTNKKIKLLGKNSAELSSIDASDFIKDGILDSVSLVSTAEDEVTVDVPYLKFVFNTDSGKDPVRVSVKDLVDVYTGANISLTGYTATTDSYTAPTATDTVNAAISKLAKGVDEAKTSGVTSFGEKTGAITVNSGSTTNGDINFTMSSNKLTGSVYGLKSAAYTLSTAYATSAQGTKADNALQSISKGTDGSYVTTTIGTKSSNAQTVGVAVTVQGVSSASSTAMGLAEASDVKSYIDGLMAWEEN